MGFVQWIQKQAVAYVVYGVALAAMAALLITSVVKLFAVGIKNDRLDYLKNYKKGQFAIIYLIAIPLYFFGLMHVAAVKSGTDVLSCFLNAIGSAFGLVKLDFGIDDIAEAMVADKFYYGTMICCFIVTVINVLLFSASLIWQRFKNFCKKLRASFAKTLYVVVGCNAHNITLLSSLKSANDKNSRGVMLAKPDAEMRDKLYLDGICYATFDCENNGEDEFYKKLKSLLGWKYRIGLCTKKNVVVVINTDNDERNLSYAKAFNRLLQNDSRVKEKDSEGKVVAGKKFVERSVIATSALLTCYTFGEVKNQSAFAEQVKKSKGHLTLLNRYEQIAFDFVDKYPLTRFMTDKHIDYDCGLVNDGVNVNVIFVGFGPTNRRIFLRTVSDAQFFTRVYGKIKHKKVNYFVYDKSDAYNDKNLNQTYFRYSREFYKEYLRYVEEMKKVGVKEGDKAWGYLPLPDYPANDWFNPELNNSIAENSQHFKEHFCITDINSYDFYDGLKNVVCKDDSYTYVIVAFGNDMENIDLAKKISARLAMWGKSDCAYTFVKVRSKTLADNVDSATEQNTTAPYGIRTFGSTNSVYDLNKIANNPIRKMAYLKSFKYMRGNDKNSNATDDKADQKAVAQKLKTARDKAVEAWMQSEPEQKMGNFLCCLNLRTKLNLLGLDYVEADKVGNGYKDGLSVFFDLYYGKTAPEEADIRCDSTVFGDDSTRTLLAVQEHQRWNADYVCSGVIPPTKREIIGSSDGGKDLQNKLTHPNITTFAGLEEYYEITGKDMRKYDYRIMDYADKLLADVGFRIVIKD